MAKSTRAFVIVVLVVAVAAYALYRYRLGTATDDTASKAPAPAATEPAAPAPAAPTAAAPAPAETPAATDAAKTEAAKTDDASSDAAGSDAAPVDTAADATKTEAAAAPADAAQPAPPTFDVARVEPSGDAVLAGRASPKAVIALFANGKEIGRTTANDGGEWVIALETPLPPGDYELSIVSATPDGVHQTESTERLAVSIPDKAGEAPMVALMAPDAPTKVLQGPAGTDGATVVAAAEAAADAALPDAGAATPAADAAATPSTPAAGATPAATREAAAAALGVATVEKDQSRLTVSGRSTPGGKLRLYFDGTAVGEATAGPDGAWSLSVTAPADAAPGDHAVRVDQIDDGGAVIARAEVPFEVLGAADIAAAEATPTPAEATDANPVPPAPAATPAASGAPAENAATTAEVATDAEPEARPAGEPEAPKRRIIRIRRGDDLWSIAERFYGKGARFTAIYRANRNQIRDPDLIYPGQMLVVPR